MAIGEVAGAAKWELRWDAISSGAACKSLDFEIPPNAEAIVIDPLMRPSSGVPRQMDSCLPVAPYFHVIFFQPGESGGKRFRYLQLLATLTIELLDELAPAGVFRPIREIR